MNQSTAQPVRNSPQANRSAQNWIVCAPPAASHMTRIGAPNRQGGCGLCFRPCFPRFGWVWAYGRGLGPGLTSESADAVRVVLRNDLSAGPQVFLAPTGGAGLICPSWTRGRGSQVRRPAGACHPFNLRKEMALPIVESRAITGGVDTHADVHVAAALDPIGGLLGVREFPASPAGYAGLLEWLGGFGTVCLVGIEGTGSYGAGLSRHVPTAGVRRVEVDRSAQIGR